MMHAFFSYSTYLSWYSSISYLAPSPCWYLLYCTVPPWRYITALNTCPVIVHTPALSVFLPLPETLLVYNL
ncbi:hypothetical protein BD769DRAFT_1505531 [Suillus cothurnatus]|nr:hypothetical protein BD769DRAFT_1505531 [Suillus cothurnatus]